MFIIKLTLHKYNRLALTNLSTITLHPNKNMTILIGTGGIGKSSIIREMSPIPADLKQYTDGGYKEIVIEHQSITYTLTSDKDTNRHSFYRGKTNLNTGGTRKQQLMLVEEYFKYTPALHDILLGVKVFTTMSVAERKKWFMLTSNIDYTYSLGVYNKVKERHRDIIANLKLLNGKLTTEKNTCITKDKVKQLNSNLEYLNNYLTTLLNSKRNTKSIENKHINVKELTVLLSKLLQKISRKYTIDTINNKILTIGTEIEILTKQSLIIKGKIDKIKQVEKIEYQGNINILKQDILELDNRISSIKDSMYINIPLNQTELYLKAVISIYPILTQHLTDLYEYRAFMNTTRKEYDQWNIQLEHLEIEYKKLDDLKEELVITNREYERNKLHTIDCNKCGNNMYISYNKNKHIEVENELDIICTRLPKLKCKIEEYSTNIQRYRVRYGIIDKIHKLRDYPYVSLVIDYLFTNHNVNDEVTVITDTLSKIINDIEEWCKINVIDKDLDRLKNDQKILTSNMDITILDKDKLHEELVYTLHKINSLNIDMDNYKKEEKQLKEISSLYYILTTDMKVKKTVHKMELSDMYNQYVNKHIKIVKSTISEIENTLHDDKYVRMNISKLEEEVSALINKEVATKLILQKLSPTEGLIAKSLNSSLNKFLLNINHFVNLTWSYKMDIRPCDLDLNGLTYKFPVSINDRIGANDISGCSSSQQEIINLGYKLTVMKYLGIEDYPIILDEFAKSFDNEHLESAYNLIDMLVTEDKVKQVLMVSHYSNVYNRFQYATLVTLSKDMVPYKCKEYAYL